MRLHERSELRCHGYIFWSQAFHESIQQPREHSWLSWQELLWKVCSHSKYKLRFRLQYEKIQDKHTKEWELKKHAPILELKSKSFNTRLRLKTGLQSLHSDFLNYNAEILKILQQPTHHQPSIIWKRKDQYAYFTFDTPSLLVSMIQIPKTS